MSIHDQRWTVNVGGQRAWVQVNANFQLEIRIATQRDPLVVCSPTDGAMIALALSQASAAAGPGYQKARLGRSRLMRAKLESDPEVKP